VKSQETDIIIIGAGAGGGASAWALSSLGFHVLLLEAGPHYNPFTDYLLDKPQWEQFRFPDRSKHKLRHTYGQMQTLEKHLERLRSWNHIHGLFNKSNKRKIFRYHHMQGIGGSTLIFSGEAHRLHPESMKMKSRFGVAADWPLDYSELEPYYSQVEYIVGVSGPAEDAVRFRSRPYPLPAHQKSYTSQKVIGGRQTLGLTWESNPVAILPIPYDGRPGCNYCANCNRGCPRTDKGSADVTFIRKAVKSGRCTIKSGCHVKRLGAGPNDRITMVHYADDKGKAHTIAAKAVIVSCGAVESPRLLLASANHKAPEGICNESGHVGRHFMETLAWMSSGLHREALGSYRGIPSDIICWDFNAPDAIPGITGGCRFAIGMGEADFLGPINYAQRVVPGWGKKHKEEMRQSFGKIISIASMGESLPNSKTYIDLDPQEKDDLGIPVARINTFIDDMEVRRLEFMAEKSREILFASGVERVIEEYGTYDYFNATHVFGTCRMGNNPNESVVNRYCQSHRWKNLFIVDASVFPSSGGGEAPSLTIEALALRTAEYIRERFKKGDL
jgi:choline dehydrogenase-like flavoprotein